MQEHELTDWKRAVLRYREILALPEVEREDAINQLGETPAVCSRLMEMLHASRDRSDAPIHGLLDRAIDSIDSAAREESAPPSPDESLIGRDVGDWTLVEALGRGGMATVYLAERRGVGFRQQGALKLLSLLMMATGGASRFQREQQFLARMQHPNIAMLLDGGVAQDGTPYLVTELVDGAHIRDYCREHALSPHDIVHLLLQLCSAVSHAHGHLVLHRDIKPTNVMVTAQGQVKLLDFGIAKLVADAADGTQTRVFTPKYAAPEQLNGGTVTTATDVHGLGVLGRILLQDQAIVARELSRILDMATREEAARRYASVESLARDLRNWLENRPIAAADDSLGYRAKKFLRRHRGPVAAAAAVLLTAVVGLGGVLWQAAQTREQLVVAERTTQFLVKLFEEADPAVAGGSPTTARDLLSRARTTLDTLTDDRLRDQLVLSIAEAYHGMGDYSEARVLLLTGLSEPIESQALDAQLLLANASYLSGHADEPIAQLERIMPGPADAARVHSMLGKYLSSDGQYQRADAEHAIALQALRDSTPLSDRITVHRNIARNHIRQARYDDALESMQLVLGLARDAGLTLEQGEIEQMLAQVANIQGRHAEALEHSARARDLFGRVYDEEHSIMIGLARQEADTLRSMGEPAAAVEKLEQAASLARRRLGDSTETTNVLNFLSMAYGGIGRLEEAVATGLETSGMLIRMGDGENPIRGNVLGNVASYQIDLGDLEAAERNVQIARDIVAQRLPPGHPVSIFIDYQAQRIAIGRGQFAEALKRLLELAPMALESPGPGNGLTLSILASTGRQNLRLGQTGEAIGWFEREREAARTRGDNDERYLDACANLAEALLADGRVDEASAMLQPLLQPSESASAEFVASLRVRESRFALQSGDSRRARELLRVAGELIADAPKAAAKWAPEIEALQRDIATAVGR